MPISITITANNATEAKQLIHDLASVIFRLPSEAITDAEVSTVEMVESKTETAPKAAAAAPSPETAPTPTPTPTTPTAAPVNPIPNPSSQADSSSTSGQAPTAAPQYDFNQLATATMQLQQAGHNIFEIFQQFGITALNQLPKERYAEYAAMLRQRGAKI